ncbi:hypothetical protein E2C01_030894 [Portunus trituberculatus]|uniref:Uncharacterized protein n=1 Tax=Portunus trituberculatus TaxID=210409 RepID=A0A5B7EW48_PORTR|nr:hypothetical protein [Portunus trituberculatus]
MLCSAVLCQICSSELASCAVQQLGIGEKRGRWSELLVLSVTDHKQLHSGIWNYTHTTLHSTSTIQHWHLFLYHDEAFLPHHHKAPPPPPPTPPAKPLQALQHPSKLWTDGTHRTSPTEGRQRQLAETFYREQHSSTAKLYQTLLGLIADPYDYISTRTPHTIASVTPQQCCLNKETCSATTPVPGECGMLAALGTHTYTLWTPLLAMGPYRQLTLSLPAASPWVQTWWSQGS